MPKITALIHTCNDAARIGRLLDSLRPCDQVLVIDHNSRDETREIARVHGATVKTSGACLTDARHEWLLCLRPTEALSDGLEAALFEWKDQEPGDALGFSVPIREETDSGWQARPPETRLVNRNRINWATELPPHDPAARPLAGDLLRFCQP